VFLLPLIKLADKGIITNEKGDQQW
jgi:hypothetical protein